LVPTFFDGVGLADLQTWFVVDLFVAIVVSPALYVNPEVVEGMEGSKLTAMDRGGNSRRQCHSCNEQA
jgi:hypothetical protein